MKNILLVATLALTVKLNSSVIFANLYSTIKIKKLILDTPITDITGTLILQDNNADTVSGGSIVFNGGILQSGNLSTIFTGTYDSASNDSIILTGNDSLDIQSGIISFPILVQNGGNKILGRPYFSQAITLQNSSAALSMAIQTPVNQNVNLNSGQLTLDSDLYLGEGNLIIGPGTISCDGNRLTFGSYPLTTTQNLTFINSANIELLADISISNSSWIFSDVGGTSYINGNGHTIDIGDTGVLNIANGHTLTINNATIKGLGNSLIEGKVVFGNNASTLKCRECMLDFASDYTISSGQLYFYGANSVFLIKSFVLTIQSTAALTIDGVSLTWDKLSLSNDTNPIVTQSSANLVLINGGYIRSVNSTLAPIAIYSTSTSLSSNIEITSASNLIFSNASPGVPKTIQLSGNGHYIHFSRSEFIQNLILEPNLTVIFSNIVLKDFNPECISFPLANNSYVHFGDDVTIELGTNISITKPLTIVGNTLINGRGNDLTLVHADSLVHNTAGKNLTIQNTNLMGIGGVNTGSGLGRLRIENATASITLKDCYVALEDEYEINTGFFNFENQVKFSGYGQKLTYLSSAQSTILSNSELILDQGVTFSYAANVGILPQNGTSASYTQSRNRLAFSGSTSVLSLDGATLHFTHTGLVMDNGFIEIRDRGIFKSVAGEDEGPYGHAVPATGEEPVITSNMRVKVLSGAELIFDGNIIYE